MIEVAPSASPATFLEMAGTVLNENEAENCLLLGFAADLASQPPSSAPSYRFWTATHEGRCAGAFFSNPPFPAIASDAPAEVLGEWLDRVESEKHRLAGISAVPKAAELAAREWCRRVGGRFEVTMDLILYRLSRPPAASGAPGEMRLGGEGDAEQLGAWVDAFNRETGAENTLPSRRLVEGYLAKGRLFVWDDGGAVAMAGCSGPTQNGMRLNLVYTPPDKRGKGYATALVADASGRLLEAGRRQIFLFADRNNAVSNSVYRRVGFHPVTDWRVFKFEKE